MPLSTVARIQPGFQIRERGPDARGRARREEEGGQEEEELCSGVDPMEERGRFGDVGAVILF